MQWAENKCRKWQTTQGFVQLAIRKSQARVVSTRVEQPAQQRALLNVPDVIRTIQSTIDRPPCISSTLLCPAHEGPPAVSIKPQTIVLFNIHFTDSKTSPPPHILPSLKSKWALECRQSWYSCPCLCMADLVTAVHSVIIPAEFQARLQQPMLRFNAV